VISGALSMRGGSWFIQFLLLSFLGVFLVYPLVYIIPGSASEITWDVQLTRFGDSPAQQAAVLAELHKLSQPQDVQAITLPYTVASFPATQQRAAEELGARLTNAGAGVVVARERHWTSFYFREALGFQFASSDSFPYFALVPVAPTLITCLGNSLAVATITTMATTLLCLPLAYWFTRLRFPGRTFLSTLLLVPLILPPFVGAIGLQRLLDRFGTLNLWLMDLGILDPAKPIDWLGEGGFIGVVLMQVLHLYPILYLNLAAAWANVDPTLEDAARNLGAGEWRVFRTITFPLVLPGYFAGAALIFVWAFTDLGTPLVFNYLQVIPVRIFDQVSDPQRTNAQAYALVVITLLVTAVLFFTARWFVNRQLAVSGGKGAVATAPPVAGRGQVVLIYMTVLTVTFLAVLPNIGVVLTACAERWNFTPLPSVYTTAYLAEVWNNRVAAWSVRNSVIYSAVSTGMDVVIGVTLAWLVARRPSWLSSTLEGLAMLPLALPGLVLAFGYLTCYSFVGDWLRSTWLGDWAPYLDPYTNPVVLLVVAYAVRRLPYLTRSAIAGLQQISPTLEEAAENLGATRWRVLRTITLPLIAANLVAGGILTFAFALLEVSDSLMLAREERYYPITRAILGLLMRPDDGDSIASALAVLAMGLLAVSLAVAALLLGRRMGELFRA
jgi:iron(III) transport system permease protein